MPSFNTIVYGRNGGYLTLSRKHVLLFSVVIGVFATVKAGHGVIQDPIKGQGKNTLPTVMTDFFTELNGCCSALFVVGNAFGGDSGLCLCLVCLDACFVNLEFIRV